MIANLFRMFCRVSPELKSMIWKQWYQFLAKSYQRHDWNFMNLGYASVNDLTEKLHLDEMDETNRLCIQLYHQVASAIDLKDRNVLEVGSGRGGGADYIKRYLNPITMVGVDFSENAVAFCNQNYVVDGLSFETGNAESLPFTDNSFDVVINIESSHCYGSMDAFLGQVQRVLREDGYFLFADFRDEVTIDIIRKQMHNAGLVIRKETDITPNVIEALNLDNERKTARIKRIVYKPLIPSFLEFAGTKGSQTYERLKSGKYIYFDFVLQKRREYACFV